MAETVEEKQAKTLLKRLVNLKAEALVNDLIDKLVQEEAETLIEKHVKVKWGNSIFCLTG